MTNPDHETQHQLTAAIERARKADGAAFDQIYHALHPCLLRYLRVMVGDDAEDVASETWLHIARDLDSFRGDWDRFRGWAVTIARHRAIDHTRRLRRHPHLAVDHIPDHAALVDTANEALDAISTNAAIALLSTLPREQAEAILLRVVFALDSKTCGAILGRRAGAVRTAAHRGLRRLETLLTAERGTDANQTTSRPTHSRPQTISSSPYRVVTRAADPTQLG